MLVHDVIEWDSRLLQAVSVLQHVLWRREHAAGEELTLFVGSLQLPLSPDSSLFDLNVLIDLLDLVVELLYRVTWMKNVISRFVADLLD
jgi:hypothetical protein